MNQSTALPAARIAASTNPHDRDDDSYWFIRSSPVFRRRLDRIRSLLAPLAAAEAARSNKENALFEILSQCREDAVVVVTRYRASQERLAALLAGHATTKRLELLVATDSSQQREQLLRRLRDRAATGELPTGSPVVILSTDEALRGMGLEKACATLVNYDLPWNPQLIERRVERLHCWGQRRPVRVYNLAARVLATGEGGWSMDHRVLMVYRDMFGMATPSLANSVALFAMDPAQVELLVVDRQAQLSAAQAPAKSTTEQLDELFAAATANTWQSDIDRLQQSQRQLRQDFAMFFRLRAPPRDRQCEQGALSLGELRRALRQGRVALLRPAERRLARCSRWRLLVGVRLTVEVALTPDQPGEDEWLIDQELPLLWTAGQTPKIVDPRAMFDPGRYKEIPPTAAAKLAGQSVVDFLVDLHRRLKARGLDAEPLSQWSRRAPRPLALRLERVARTCLVMLEQQRQQLAAQFAEDKRARLARLGHLQRLARAQPAPLWATEVDGRIAAAQKLKLCSRGQVLGTQLLVVVK